MHVTLLRLDTFGYNKLMEKEQLEAHLLRTLYRLKLIDFNILDDLVDQLTVRMFRQQYLKSKTDLI